MEGHSLLAMIPLRLEVSLTCVTCRAPIALNAVAPQARCDGCGREVRLGVEVWRELLRAPLDEAAAMRDGEQRDAIYESAEGLCRRIYRREEIRCAGCASPVDATPAKVAASPSGWIACARCQRPILSRTLPAIAPSVSCFVGEDPALAFNQPMRPEPLVIGCPTCGGSLSIDGSSRNIVCKFCQSAIALSEEIWSRVRGARSVAPFWACTAGAAIVNASPSYGAIHAGAIDGAGNVYLAAEDAVYALDADLAPRWVRSDIHVRGFEFVLFPDGRVWVHGRSRAEVLSCDDGRTLGPGAPLPHLSLFTAYAAQGASVLTSGMNHERTPPFEVQRVDLEGRPLMLFAAPPAPPPKKGLLGALFGVPAPPAPIARIASAAGVKAFPGPGTDVFLLECPNFDVRLSLYSADRALRWNQMLPISFAQLMLYRVFAMPDGSALVAESPPIIEVDNAIVINTLSPVRSQTLLRVGPAGVFPFMTEWPIARLNRKTFVLPTPRGEILLFGTAGDIIRVTGDGREVWCNEAAKAVARQGDIANSGN
jgi:hypothetical protein